jgi:hypothetical protein
MTKRKKLSTMDILTNSVSDIRDKIKTFVLNSPECEHMITDMMETTNRCRRADNIVKTCEWVFCPLRRRNHDQSNT